MPQLVACQEQIAYKGSIGRRLHSGFKNGILKDELLDKVHSNYNEAVRNVSIAISIYNHQRPHGSIDYLTPIEAHFRSGELKRRWKNYYIKKK